MDLKVFDFDVSATTLIFRFIRRVTKKLMEKMASYGRIFTLRRKLICARLGDTLQLHSRVFFIVPDACRDT